MSRLDSASRTVLALSAILVPALANAADLPAARATLERLRLTPFGEGLTVSGVTYDPPRRFHLDALVHYESSPVVGFNGAGDPIDAGISDRLTFDLVGGFRVDSWLEIGMRLPVVVNQSAGDDFNGYSLGSSGVGDPELSVRGLVLRPEDAGVGVSLIATGSLPASGGGSFIGERGGTFSPAVALTRPLGDRATLGLDLGTTFRWNDTSMDSLGGGDEIFASLGGVVHVGGGVSLVGELLTDTGMDDPFADDGLGMEWLGAVRAQLGGGFHGIVGGGTSIIDAYGDPAFRVLAGIGWTMGEEPAEKAEPEPLVEEKPVPLPKAEPKVEPKPAMETRPAPVVVEPVVPPEAPRKRHVTTAPRATPSFHAAVRKTQLEIHFPDNGTELSAESKHDIDVFVQGLGSNIHDIAWRVEGYSDNTKPLVPNRKLSRTRAEKVTEYLRAKGMPEPWREDWYGPQFPKGDNRTAAGRKENRRADVTVVIE
jgi:outer membrane protein OmpA-like peptidoglycan-associated protein